MDAIAAGQQQHFITTYPGEQKLIHEISVYPSEYGLCVFVKDITERERAQAALKESETKFRTLAEQSPNMIFINKNGRVVYANQKCTEVMGYALTELYSPDFDFLTLVNAPSRDAVMANFRAHAEGREVGPYEYSLVTRSGAAIDCILTSKLVNYDGGPAILGTVTDITERKNAEARLAEVSSHQEAILSAVPDIIMEVDNDKVYKWANQAGIDFFGDGVIGKKAADYFAEEQNTYDTVEPVFEGSDGTVHVESWQLRKDGEKRLLAWWCRSLKDDQGKVIGALSAAQDITDRRAAEEALRQVNSG
jgi:PAS domain S-box-containing protein